MLSGISCSVRYGEMMISYVFIHIHSDWKIFVDSLLFMSSFFNNVYYGSELKFLFACCNFDNEKA